MESAVCVSGFLLLLFSTGVHLSPDPKLIFRHEGQDVEFDAIFSIGGDNVLFRVGGDGDLLLLINCSQPERPQPHGYEFRCDKSFSGALNGIIMSKLTMLHSGDYRVECWKGGNNSEHTNYSLTVCAEGGSTSPRLSYGDNVELCSLDSALGNGSSLQLYRHDWRLENYILVLDTKSSLEPLVEDLKGRLQVNLNTSLLTLSRVREHFDFYCTVWRGAQCQSYSHRTTYMDIKYVLAHDAENVTLPCIAKGELPDQVFWDINIFNFGELIINHTHPQQVMYNETHPQVMYMLKSSQTGDYSLIIPSLQHSGTYTCTGSETLNKTVLLICAKLPTSDVMFSPGQRLLLNISEYLHELHIILGKQWYCQRGLQPQVLIADTYKTPGPLPEDLRDRVTVSKKPFDTSLVISNLTAEDSGVYTWRVLGFGLFDNHCFEGSFHLLYLDPLGVHSPFYRVFAPLLGCGLLGLVTAVSWFKLRSRRGEKTSGRQSREGQQSRDEDLYEELEMDEFNTHPSAVSEGAVEHSV